MKLKLIILIVLIILVLNKMELFSEWGTGWGGIFRTKIVKPPVDNTISPRVVAHVHPDATPYFTEPPTPLWMQVHSHQDGCLPICGDFGY